MTLEEFAEKWKDNKLPVEASHHMGTTIAVLEHVGFSKEEILELVGDTIDLSHYLTTTEGLEELDQIELDQIKEETKH